ncbi:MAG: precorrin-8X methylmutase [Deltaproteobacteria bacterium]|nr:precorrin-8X methylmutase [Deltaproteobacteria bacterium]
MTNHADCAKNGKKAVLLLGHGSKLQGANDTLRTVARAVQEKTGLALVMPAFLQIEKPGISEAIDIIAAKGFDEITVMPYFLYSGAHVTSDIPGELNAAKERHPGLKVGITPNLGFHDKLIEIVLERLGCEVEPPQGATAKTVQKRPEQHPIEKESLRIIGRELGPTAFSEGELSVVKRVIHTTADFDYKDILRFSPRAIEAGVRALEGGARIITDVRMAEAGITGARLEGLGVKVVCYSADADVAAAAIEKNMTKTAASMQKAAPFMDKAVVVIGNAPTALVELLKLTRGGAPRPALVIGVPVGFVGAAESKEELMNSGLEFIASTGRKGGSTVAAAIANALAILANERKYKPA